MRDDTWMVRRIASVVVLLHAAAVAGQPAPPAPQPPPSDAAKLFEEGRTLAKDGKFAEACDRFTKSYQLDRGVGTELNLADCHEHLGHLAEAWRMFDDAAVQFEHSNDDRSKFARSRANALGPKLAIIVVKLPDPGAAGTIVVIAGHQAPPAAEIRDHADPGDVVVTVAAPGKPAYAETKQATAGATIVFDVGATASSGGGGGSGVASGGEGGARRHSRVVVAYTVGGFGLASFAAGVVFGLKAKSDYQKQIDGGNCTEKPLVCNPEGYAKTNSAGTLANVGTVFSAVGIGLVATAAVVYFTAPKDTVLAPSASPSGVGVTLSGSF